MKPVTSRGKEKKKGMVMIFNREIRKTVQTSDLG